MKKFLHDGKMGDLIYSLPSVQAIGGGTILATDPELMDLHPVVASQPYVHGFERWGGEPVDYDFRPFRGDPEVKTRHLAETQWLALCRGGKVPTPARIMGAFPWCLARPWMTLEPQYAATYDTHRAPIVVHVSDRWPGELDWGILRRWVRLCVFLGLREEWQGRWEWMPYHATPDVSRFAAIIAGARLFVGNQSLGFALAEALKVPRVLARNADWPNCDPRSPTGHTVLSHELVEHYLRSSEPFRGAD